MIKISDFVPNSNNKQPKKPSLGIPFSRGMWASDCTQERLDWIEEKPAKRQYEEAFEGESPEQELPNSDRLATEMRKDPNTQIFLLDVEKKLIKLLEQAPGHHIKFSPSKANHRELVQLMAQRFGLMYQIQPTKKVLSVRQWGEGKEFLIEEIVVFRSVCPKSPQPLSQLLERKRQTTILPPSPPAVALAELWLPDELFERVLAYLLYFDHLVACSLVSKRWNTIARALCSHFWLASNKFLMC